MRMKKILTLVTLVLGIYCAQAQTNAGAFASNKLGEPVMSDLDSPQILTKADASSFAGGSGTEADPYLIANTEHLSNLAAMSSDKSGTFPQKLKGVYFKQVADIVFEKETPMILIGNGAWFAGTYDGDGYAIKNYTLKYNAQNVTNVYMALFLNCAEATLKNIRMVGTNIDINVEGTGYSMMAAGLVGNCQYGKIVNCTTEGTYNVQAGGKECGSFIGGLVAYLSNSTIDNCRTYGNYRNKLALKEGTNCYAEVAGIAVEMFNSKVIDCISHGNLDNQVSGNAANLQVRTAGTAAYTENSQIMNVASVGESIISIADNKQKDGKTNVYTAGVVAVLNTKSTLSNAWSAITTLKSEGATTPIEPAYTSFVFGESKAEKCLYVMTEEDAKKEVFVEEINQLLPEGTTRWLYRKDDYPALQPLHNVTLPLLTGATTTPGEGVTAIEDGERFRFTLTLDEEYNESKPVVTVGDKTLEPDTAMNYVTDMVTADMVIKITGIVKNSTTANENITTGSKVYAAGGVLHIQPKAPVQVGVFNMQGQLMESAMISGDTQIQLPQGIYVVRLGDQSYKVCISE